jgi:hypothetical protein
MFSGSYDPGDVTFLLKPTRIAPTPVVEKERLIQSGRRHYSEMIGHEHVPSPRYLTLFHQAVERELGRLAGDVLTLAGLIAARRAAGVTVVSLARAGTPIGVLIGRLLRGQGVDARHYSVSIIRDRGIDQRALAHVVARHPVDSIAFVDGWTAKGVIAAELEQAVSGFNRRYGVALDPGLFVVADLCGAASAAATDEDYLMPSCLLGAIVSGLVSRSVLNAEVVGQDDFHACVYYEQLESSDRSRWFVDTVWAEMMRQQPAAATARGVSADRRAALRRESEAFQRAFGARFDLDSLHHLKPGVGEATRVLLRRVPAALLLREPAATETAHLRLLAREKDVPVIIEPSLPYRAAAVIGKMDA